MAYEARVFVNWRYTTDRTEYLVFKILQEIVTQMRPAPNGASPKVGGTAADGTENRAAASFRPRVALLYNAANKLSRRVVCFSPNSALYCGTDAAPDNTLLLHAGHSGETFSFVCYGYEGERQRGARS